MLIYTLKPDDLSTLMSAGMRSPNRTSTMSPSTRLSVIRLYFRPSLITVASFNTHGKETIQDHLSTDQSLNLPIVYSTTPC